MDTTAKMVPVTLMLDLSRHSKLKAVSKSTRISMSEIVRLSLDHLLRELGDPDQPDLTALSMLITGRAPPD